MRHTGYLEKKYRNSRFYFDLFSRILKHVVEYQFYLFPKWHYLATGNLAFLGVKF